MVEYDPVIITTFAARLYAKAKWIVVKSTVVAAFLGLIVGASGGMALRVSPFLLALVGGALLGLLGYSIGMERSFRYRLEAQMALCQLKIEQNTGKIS